MVLLILKIVLVPALVAGVTLASRRWGPRIGGLLTAFPVVAGPTLCFYAVEQGATFAAHAAQATMVGAIGIASFCVAYGRCCRRLGWPACLAIGCASFGLVTTAAYWLQLGLYPGLLVTFAGVFVAERLLPQTQPAVDARTSGSSDLIFRMIAAAMLVVTLTEVAEYLGPSLSGYLTAFPIAVATIAAFSHVERGPDAVVLFFQGFMPALNSFALFCFTLSTMVERFGLAESVAVALGVQLIVHGWLLHRMSRRAAVDAVAARAT